LNETEAGYMQAIFFSLHECWWKLFSMS